MKKYVIIFFAIFVLLFLVILTCNNNIEKNYDISDIKAEFVKYLESRINNDGSFKYTTNLDETRELDDYNMLRHALSYYALLIEYEKNENVLKEKQNVIEKGIDFIIPKITLKDGKAFVIADDAEEFDLGTLSLSIILMSEYQKAFNCDTYNKYIDEMANGIMYMQRSEGRFNHLITAEKLTLKKKDEIIYYEGEAVIALCKAYEITKNEEYLISAQNAINYYISMNYEQYADHWQEYAIGEFLKFNDETQYVEYAIANLCNKVEKCQKQNIFYNTDLETLKCGISIYSKNTDFEGKYTLKEVQEVYDESIKQLEDDFNNLGENSTVEEFFKNRGANHIRIDDLAHYILGMY